eukprot:jgi/Mesvir1/1499/Mv14482-RA.1
MVGVLRDDDSGESPDFSACDKCAKREFLRSSLLPRNQVHLVTVETDATFEIRKAIGFPAKTQLEPRVPVQTKEPEDEISFLKMFTTKKIWTGLPIAFPRAADYPWKVQHRPTGRVGVRSRYHASEVEGTGLQNPTATATSAVAYWGFNGDSRDYGVNGWNGAIKGSSQYSSSIKYSGTHSLTVTDTSGGLDVASTALQTMLASDFSLSVFVYFTNNTQQWQSIFTGNAGVQWGLVYNPSWHTTPGFAFFDRGSNVTAADKHTWFATTPTLNAWHHIVVTRSGSQVSMYYDNALKIQFTPTATKLGPGTSTLCFGNQAGSLPYANFMGHIDQGAIYSSAINAATVNSIYTTNAEIIAPGALGTVLQQYGSGTDFVRLQLANSGALELETRVGGVSRVMDKFPSGNVFVGDAAKHNMVLTRLGSVSPIPASIPCEWLFAAGDLNNTGTGSNLAVVSGTNVDVSTGEIRWSASATGFSSGTDHVTMSLSEGTVGLTTFSLVFDYYVDSTKLDGSDIGLFQLGPNTTNRIIGTVGSNGTSLLLNTVSTVSNGDLNIAVADVNGVTAVFSMDTWHTVSITRLSVASESSSAIDNSKLIISVDGGVGTRTA